MEKKILVVDNHPVFLRMMTTLLGKEGHTVLTAADGLAALAVLENFTPEVIFLDLVMPGIDGEKLCRMIRRNPKFKDIYVIIVTAIAAEEGVNFSEFGADACIAKGPFDAMAKHILTTLDQCLQKIPTHLPGAIIGLEGVHPRQITKELFAIKSHLDAILQSMAEGILETTPEGKIIYANPAAVFLIGLPEENLLASNLPELFHEGDRKKVEDLLAYRDTGSKAISEESLLNINGKQISLNFIPIVGHEDGNLILLLNDMTERKKLEAQLQQTQKMEAIGTLAGGIAHDFNNILSAILGYAELANLGLEENSKVRYNLQQSIRAALRAKDLVQQILAFSRQSKQERKPLDIEPIIKEGLNMLRASLPTTIEIRQNLEEDLGAIEADPTQIHQVVMNLCTNAAHAMSENGGVLEVSLTKFDMDAQASAASPEIEPGPYLRLRVSDTGHGMTPEILQRIFDPYFTTKEPGKGTGLGLAVVHGIVKSYGGGLAVSSQPGKGTTFDIYFPKIEPVKAPLEAGRIEPSPLGGHERVLMVDDEKAIVEIGQEILQHLGYEVVVRTSSIEALELFRTRPDRFDLVITDMTMPNMTGDKLAQELILIRPDIPIILCTGFSERITEKKAKALGVREFVMKPLVMKDLSKAVRRALDWQKKKKGQAGQNFHL